MSLSRPSGRLRLVAASTGALALAGLLALSGVVGGGFEETEAAWQDSEVAQTTITAQWPTDSWVRSTANAFTNYADYTPTRNPTNFTHERFDDRPSLTGVREIVATRGDQYNSPQNFGIRTHSSRPASNLTFCSQTNQNPWPLLPANYIGCTGGSAFTPDFAQARTKGFGTAGGFAHPANNRFLGGSDDILLVEAQNVRTMAECSPTGESRALAPTADATWGGASGLFRPSEPYGQGQGIGFVFANALDGSTATSDNFSALAIPAPNTRVTRWMRPLRIELGVYTTGNVYFRATITSRQHTAPGYALSDLYVTIDQYTTDSGNPYTGSFTMILSRSECGIVSQSMTHQKLNQVFEPRTPPTYPNNPANANQVITSAPLPNSTGQLVYPGDPNYPNKTAPVSLADQQMTVRGLLDDAVTAEMPLGTTVASPLEDANGTDTTTSAPPDPSDEDRSTTAGTTSAAPTTTTTTTTATKTATTTSASPAIATPSDPGTLSPTAQTAKVGTVEVDGDELDVVVKGDTVPADARTALAALESWINEGARPSGDWRTFTSSEPDSDGWRWAAVNQATGTIVYIR